VYIDPEACIDCDACVSACPVDAIYADSDLPEADRKHMEINAQYYARARSG
jgi:ferredoxin--NADP+ reductase